MATLIGQAVVPDLFNKIEELRKQLQEERNKNEELRKQLRNERSKNDKSEIGDHEKQKETTSIKSQTNLDGLHIDELFKASITLKRQKEEHLAQQSQLKQQQQQLEQQQKQLEHQQQLLEHQQQQIEHQQQKLRQQQQLHHHHQPREVTLQTQQQHLPDFNALNSMQSITYMSDKSFENKQPVVTQLHYPNVTLPKQVVENKNLTSQEKKILEDLFQLDGTMTTVLDKLKAVTDEN